MTSRRVLSALSLLFFVASAGCAAEPAPAPDADAADSAQSDEELNADPRCPGPITMSKRAYAALPAGYESLSAADKQTALVRLASDAPYEKSCRPSSGLFLSGIAALGTAPTIKVSVERSSDEMPAGRRKMVHPFGAVAGFDFVKDASAPAYSGILAPGGVVHGVMRASLGGDPNVLGFTPGLALKFLVDGKPSLNVVTMHSLMGQGRDTNYFRHAFSNQVHEAHADLPRDATFFDYAKADAFAIGQNLVFLPALARGPEAPTPNFLHVDHLAVRTADGALVPEAQRKHPTHLVVRAPQAIVAWADGAWARGADYRDVLGELAVGTTVYEVFAKEGENGTEVRVGALKTTSKFVASPWGDYRLFFRHNDHQNNADVAR